MAVGHGGIVEMTVDGRVLYGDGLECGVLPKAADVFAILDGLDGYARTATARR